jgi:acyl transferase domain-containing protein
MIEDAPPPPAGGEQAAAPAGDVAVVGMAGRFPGAGDVDQLWANLCAGVESIRCFSPEELAASGVPPAVFTQPNYVPARGALEGSELFDAAYFAISGREAEMLDPQQRLFLECAATALAGAGYDPERFDGAIGLFGGAGFSGYLANLHSRPELVRAFGVYATLLANDKDYLTTRVAYKLDLRGPCVTVQTACSTGLVAVHLACQSLLNGECDLALAGGVSVAVPERIGYLYEEEGIYSPDGHCRAFDAAARGTVGGSGVALVVLRRLAAALADGDNVLAVVKGTAINNDGSQKQSFTAPSLQAQAEVVAEALAVGRVPAASIGFVEAHGTGTALGDPVEVAALARAFGLSGAARGTCALGSLKTNIGHLDAAAGAAGLVKAVLALHHGKIPPTLHYRSPNPRIDFAATPFHVNAELLDWPRQSAPRRAGVSSLGIGGTNAHAVLEEAPEPPAAGPARPWSLLTLSARGEAALEAASDELAAFLGAHPATPIADAAFTLQVGRRLLPHRRILVAADAGDAERALAARDPARVFSQVSEARDRPVCLLLSGQGSQYAGMGRGLYLHEPVYRREIDRCSALAAAELGRELSAALYPADPAAADPLARAGILQPALFAVGYALARLWMSWGVRPRALLGHSLGEYVAACLAGVLPLADALRLVAVRGRLCERLPAGAMLAVAASPEDLAARLAGGLELAAVNGPRLCTVAGPVAVVERLQDDLEAAGVDCRRLHTGHAFHSAAVEPLAAELGAVLETVRLEAGSIPYLSNVTGDWQSAAEAADPGYWLRHLRAPVRFAAGLERLLAEPDAVLLEVGPGNALATLALRHPRRLPEQPAISSLRHGGEAAAGTADDRARLLHAAGHLWMAGARIDWQACQAGERRRRLRLPTYPFERQRFWVERRSSPPPEAAAAVAPAGEDGAEAPGGPALYRPVWRQTLPLAAGTAAASGPWLLLLDEQGVGERLGERLEAAGAAVARWRAGGASGGGARQQAAAQEIDPASRSACRAALAALAAGGQLPRRIVHLWGLGAGAAPAAAEWQRLLDAQERAFQSLVYLAEGLAAVAPGAPVALWAVCDRVQAVGGEEAVAPEKATLLAACRVIPQEYPNVACRTIDVVVPAAGSPEREVLVDRLLAEALNGAPETTVAYRGGRRWVQEVERLPETATPGAGPRLRDRGVYLITGGGGRVGLALAEVLARQYRARLVLVSRSPLVTAAAAGGGAACGPLGRLEKLGAEVLTVAADVADLPAMRAAVEAAQAHFGVLHGVIHAAGLVRGGWLHALQGLQPPDLARHLRPKALGAMVLAAACRGLPLDFVVLVSSLSSVLGGLGMAAYAAANCWLDAFAELRGGGGGVPWVSVGWDGWRFPREEDAAYGASRREGMEPAAGRAAESAGAENGSLTAEQGAAALLRVLALPAMPRVLVAGAGFRERLARWVEGTAAAAAPAPVEAAPADGGTRHPRPGLTTAYLAARTPMEKTLVGLWEELLGMRPVGVHDDFFALGGQSLLGVRLTARLRQAFALDLPLRVLFEHPTVARLAEACELALIDQIDQLEEGEALRLAGGAGEERADE